MTNIEIIVNALLENSVISEEEAIELVEMDELKDYKSFEDWKRNGYSVKKDEHKLASCIIWQPTEEVDKDGKKTQSFKRRWANIFSRQQVELTADRKARRELENAQPKAEKSGKKAESPKVMKNSKKAETKAKKQTSKKSEKATKAVKVETTKKAESKKTQPKAEKKLAKANTTKVVKAAKSEKNQPKAEKKVTKKLATKEVKSSYNISKRTEGKRQYIVITNYDKNGNVKASAELPSNIYSSLDEERKASFRKIFNIA